MKKVNLTLRRKEDENYFFGYYDLQPYSSDNLFHLTHKTFFMDRIPTPQDVAEIGYLRTDDFRYVPVAQTRAWNFQQGAFLQWYEEKRSVIFNDFDGENYISRIVDLNGTERKRFNRPFASVSLKSHSALSVNFSRIYDFRRGYGYCNLPDPWKDVTAPAEDGIFRLDLRTGKEDLLLSYRRMKELFEEKPFTDAKIVVNHVTFNPSGTKFVFLLRNFCESGKKWGTVLAVSDLFGNVVKLTGFEVNSHYSWKDDDTLMIYSGLPEWGIYFIDTTTGKRERLNDPLCDRDDIHCNYSHDRLRFIGDGYPQNDMRSLYYYDFRTKKSRELCKVYSVPVKDPDIRCDLHARWSRDDTRISYDTTENGVREIMQVVL
ncbi:MAG: hypothetical protein ACI4ST_00685 [Candidatus Gallimonas sp.]